MNQRPDEKTIAVAREQIVTIGNRVVFRIIDVMSGDTLYYSGDKKYSPAESKIFDREPTDPLQKLQANITNTGKLYGFIVPKGNERQMIFKTNDVTPLVGQVPGKGSECAINSTITFHIKMLKEIAELMVAEGYPKFILIDDILDEKARKKREKDAAKAAGKKVSPSPPENPNRSFKNTARACALKNIILRWMDKMQEVEFAAGKRPLWRRYFYRPISAQKTKHKGTGLKGIGK
jgi:hypothetical protein